MASLPNEYSHFISVDLTRVVIGKSTARVSDLI